MWIGRAPVREPASGKGGERSMAMVEIYDVVGVCGAEGSIF